MRKRAIVTAAVALATSAILAMGPARGEMLPPADVAALLASLDLRPAGPAQWRGDAIIVRAVAPDGTRLRVVIDAVEGAVVALHPVGPLPPRHWRGALVGPDGYPLEWGEAPPPAALSRSAALPPQGPRVIAAPRHLGEPPAPRSQSARRAAAPATPPLPRARPADSPSAPEGGFE